MVGGLFGPLTGQADILLSRVLRKLEQGEVDWTAARQLAEGFTAGNSLWYARLAFDRLVKVQLQALVDPDHAKRFRRIERWAKKQFDQDYWWRPGKALPR